MAVGRHIEQESLANAR